MTPFLSIIGIGEDGVAGLSGQARELIGAASLVVGGGRHLALAQSLIAGRSVAWPSPIGDAVPLILQQAPGTVVALASGDPFCFGVGPMLAHALPAGAWQCLPQVSCLSLACARLGWAQQEAEVISFCGRPVAALRAVLQPGRRVLALSEDETTPAAVARLLDEAGFGPSEIVVLEALGGARERVSRHLATGFDAPGLDRLNMMAITLASQPGTRALSRLAGLPDDAFAQDGQLTKREIRAATLAALAPLPGQMLWDIGTGSGSIAIEWMRAHPANRAVALDRRADRLTRAGANAQALGVPGLRCIEGGAPEALVGLPSPDAVFIGGGAQHPDVIARAWEALPPGGRIVVNAVTIETDLVLFKAFADFGGNLTRIGVERLGVVGTMHGYRPAMTITQWAGCKP